MVNAGGMYSQFSFFPVVMFCKVAMNTELANMKSLLLPEICTYIDSKLNMQILEALHVLYTIHIFLNSKLFSVFKNFTPKSVAKSYLFYISDNSQIHSLHFHQRIVHD